MTIEPLRVCSLFSGIGGLDLGLERAGMKVVSQCEIDPYARRVLAKHWPNVPCHDDVTTREYTEGEADVVCGGFPCQDVSNAGKRAGLSAPRSGLYLHSIRAIRVVRPKYGVLENVAALLGGGLDRVLGDLAEIGYGAEWLCVSGRDVGAPHQRERVFIVAHNGKERVQRFIQRPIPRFPEFSWCEDVRGVEDLRNRPSIPQPLIRGTSDGVPSWMDRLGGLGNAVIPQVAEIVGRAIVVHHKAEREL